MNRHPSADRPPDINQERRWLLGVAATALAGTWLDGVRIPAQVIAAQTTGVATRARNAGPTFGTIKQVKAGVLDVGYVESGPVDGRVVLLLHGWPYDVHTYHQVGPRLEAAGYPSSFRISGATAQRCSARVAPSGTGSSLPWPRMSLR